MLQAPIALGLHGVTCALPAHVRSASISSEVLPPHLPAGEPTYLPERERILGQRAQQTERLAAAAARRGEGLRLAYSLSIAASYLLFVVDGLQRTVGRG